jgi:hypothetical protein
LESSKLPEDSYGSAYSKPLRVAQPVRQRLHNLQNHLEKHMSVNTVYGVERKSIVSECLGTEFLVFELPFSAQKQLEVAKSSFDSIPSSASGGGAANKQQI